MFVSVVLPVHNERDNLSPLLTEIGEALREYPHEIVAVDDGSTDGSAEALDAARAAMATVRVVRLRARAGQSAALAAGFDAARGEVIVMMDADGQNDPGDVPTLLEALARDQGLAAVVGYRVDRRDSRWKLVQSRIANGVRNWVTRDSVRDTGCSLKAVRRQAAQQVPRFAGMHRFIPTLLRQRGGRVLELPVSHRPRRFGRSKYGMWNRVFVGLRDAVGVRWLQRRALRYSVQEDRHAET